MRIHHLRLPSLLIDPDHRFVFPSGAPAIWINVAFHSPGSILPLPYRFEQATDPILPPLHLALFIMS